MAPLPPSSTRRYFVDYETCLENHTTMVRTDAGVSPAAFTTAFQSIMTELSSLLYTVNVAGVRTAALGSDVSLPVTSGLTGYIYGGPNGAHGAAPIFLDFIGRSSAGRRARMSIYGLQLVPQDYRLTSGDNSHIQNVVGILNSTTGMFIGIDGNPVTWYGYANVGYNAYWQREVRS